MEDYSTEELQDALRAITSLISKSEKAQAKLEHHPSQRTLLRNRIAALRIASSLIAEALQEETPRK